MNEAAARPASSEEIAPGRLLARLRTERNLSVADVAQRLKYAVRQIEALEAEEFSRLPGTTFVRGMIRGYAKLLEIDPEPLLKSLERRQIPGTATVDLRAKRVPFPDGTKRRGTRVYAVLSLLVLGAVGIVLYEWHIGGLPALPRAAQPEIAQAPEQPEAVQAQAPAPVASSPAPAQAAERQAPRAQTVADKPAAPAPVTAVPKASTALPKTTVALPSASTTAAVKDVKTQTLPGQGRIFMEFADDAWVEITDGEGKLLMAQLNPSGSRRVVSGHPPFALVVGNAAAVRVVYNDKPFDLMPYVKIEVARFTLK